MKHLYLIVFLFLANTLIGQDPHFPPTHDAAKGWTESHSSLPVGSIIAMADNVEPSGYLLCDGRVISQSDYPELYNYLGSRYGSAGKLPDLRGYFLRGWSGNYFFSPDPDRNRAIGSTQTESFKSHNHTGTTNSTGVRVKTYTGRDDGNDSNQAGQYPAGDAGARKSSSHYTWSSTENHSHSFTTGFDGATETRPDNRAVMFFIKASPHSQTDGKVIAGEVKGAVPAFIDYTNTKGFFVSSGNDNAFFGMKNRNGANGSDDDFNTIISWGDNANDDLVFENTARGTLMTIRGNGSGVEIEKGGLTIPDGSLAVDDHITASSIELQTIEASTLRSLTPGEEIEIEGDVWIKPIAGQAEGNLYVTNIINAEDLEITPGQAGAPDYVFEESYELISLEDIEAYIKEHSHLPEVPSAKEIEAEGYSAVHMDFTLLKKVEELTLHFIELSKQNKSLIEDNKMLMEELHELKKLVKSKN